MSRTRSVLLRFLILILLAIFFAAPFLWLLSISFSTKGNIYAFPSALFPQGFSISNYIQVWRTVPMGSFMLNTLKICFMGVFLTLLVSSLAAYPLARYSFPGRDLLFFCILSTLLLPEEAGLIVNFMTVSRLGLGDTLMGVYLPGVATAFGIFLMRQAFLTIPGELEDAARLDGASELAIWRHVMLPLARPALATLAIFSFVAYWNSFLWPLIILKDPGKFPVAVGLSWLAGTFSTNFRFVAAGSVLTMIPILLLFLLLQKQFLKGMTQGAIR